MDGQHILHVCQEIAPVEVGCVGNITEEVFGNRFLRRLVYTVVYVDPAYYVHESRRLNAHHFARQNLQQWERRCKRCGNCVNTMANP